MVFQLDSKSAKVWKSFRSRQELSNEYVLAKFGVDTAESGPLKVCQQSFCQIATSLKETLEKNTGFCSTFSKLRMFAPLHRGLLEGAGSSDFERALSEKANEIYSHHLLVIRCN